MTEDNGKVWPAATVRVGSDTMHGRILAMWGTGEAQRALIAAADRLTPADEFDGIWEARRSDGALLGYITHADLEANADQLVGKIRRWKAEEAEPEDGRYTMREVVLMILGGALLGAAAMWSSGLLRGGG